MRRLIGGAVLVGGVIVLGLYAGTRPAHRIEEKISAQAQAALQGAVHGLQAEVRGRDITLTGLADGTAERDRVMTALDAIPGRRVVRARVDVLPEADPFLLRGRRGPHGASWEGNVPREQVRDDLAGEIGEEAAAGLSLAAGAPDIAWGMAAAAAARALAALDSGEVVLQGREITLTGAALTPDRRDAAASALSDLPEGYTAALEVTTLDDGRPFALDIEAESGKATWRAGKLPLALDPLDLDTAYGAPIAGDVTQGRIGAEREDWAQAAEAGLAGLSRLMEGRLRIEGQTLALTGLAADPAAAAAARGELDGLPEGFSPLVELELNDDGQPFALMLRKTATGLRASGKLPASMQGDDLEALAGAPLRGEVAVARIGTGEEVFTGAARAALRAAGAMKTAEVALSEEGLTFDALAATPREAARAEALLAALPGGLPVSVRIEVEDDGRPFELRVQRPAEGAWIASGKVPAVLEGFDYAAAAGVAALDAGAVQPARIGAEAHAFADAVAAGLAALSLLDSGEMVLGSEVLRLSGEAADTEAAAQAEAALAALPGGISPEIALELLEDGTPPAFQFHYTVGEGGALAGKLPAGMTPPEIAGLVALDRLAGTPDQARDDTSGAEPMRAALAALAPWLGQLEEMTLELSADGGVSGAGIASPGVDLALTEDRLAEAVGGSVSLLAGPDAPEGAQRDNPVRGAQRGSGGIWLPVVAVQASADGCAAASEAALDGRRIGFVTGAFRLDAASFAAVNAVAAVALQCARAGVVLEVGGHSDASGNAESNKALSARRAETVAAALVARGVPQEALRAVGHGAEQPIADNDTPEGRAANRRTSLTWSE